MNLSLYCMFHIAHCIFEYSTKHSIHMASYSLCFLDLTTCNTHLFKLKDELKEVIYEYKYSRCHLPDIPCYQNVVRTLYYIANIHLQHSFYFINSHHYEFLFPARSYVCILIFISYVFPLFVVYILCLFTLWVF
jgi:hypothetical protein